MAVIEMTDNSKAAHQPGCSTVGHSGCFKCVVTLATVMGLIIVAMVAGFILHFFRFATSGYQDAPSAKVQILCNLKESDETGRYDIFTVEKGASYLIFGWVAFSEAPNEEITLTQMMQKGEDRTLQRKRGNQTEIFFRKEVKMATGAKISISFQSKHVDSNCKTNLLSTPNSYLFRFDTSLLYTHMFGKL
ncbi:hypothetical protein GBF38_018702, partial [Nibea albiflora]